LGNGRSNWKYSGVLFFNLKIQGIRPKPFHQYGIREARERAEGDRSQNSSRKPPEKKGVVVGGAKDPFS